MELVALPASSSMEVGQAARALAQKNVDLICQIHDNQNDAAFPVIADAARDAKLPLFSFTSEQAEQGAILALANDHYQGGKEAGAVMARVMRGQAPASLPYRPMQQTRLSINLEACAQQVTC